MSVGNFIFKEFLAIESLGISEKTWSTFLEAAEAEFQFFPFHNSLHACDCTASAIFLLKSSDLLHKLDPLANLAMIVACLCHDIGHPGVPNKYLIASKDQIAI